eukprot:6662719-Prymnesium_polylepis.1
MTDEMDRLPTACRTRQALVTQTRNPRGEHAVQTEPALHVAARARARIPGNQRRCRRASAHSVRTPVRPVVHESSVHTSSQKRRA